MAGPIKFELTMSIVYDLECVREKKRDLIVYFSIRRL